MIKIYGASDDLIVIEGTINEEFDFYDVPAVLVKCSDGSEIKFSYTDDGLWKAYIVKTGSANPRITFVAVYPKSRDYSDIVELDDVKTITAGELVY